MVRRIITWIGNRFTVITTEKSQLRAELARLEAEVADLKMQVLGWKLLLEKETQVSRAPSSPPEEPQENPSDGIPYLAEPKDSSLWGR